MKAPLEFLAGELAGRKDEVLLIGGHALAAYGVMRQTFDVDLMIAEETRGPLEHIFSVPVTRRKSEPRAPPAILPA